MAQLQSDMNIFPLSDTWTLWFHNVNDDNWSEESYKKVCEIKTLRDFWIVFNQIETVMAGMFFLMKNDIFPRWEDINNINGGYLSFRISKKDTDKSWVNLAQAMVGNTLTRQPEKMDIINGISISPKINNCILKIWTNEANSDIGIFNDQIEGLNFKEVLHLRHQEQLDLGVGIADKN